MVKLTTNTLFGFLILLLWFPEKGRSYTSVRIYFEGSCYASCGNKSIAPYAEIIKQGEGRCFWEGTECEVAVCCKCYNSQTGKNTTFTFDRCESFREQFGGDYVQIGYGK